MYRINILLGNRLFMHLANENIALSKYFFGISIRNVETVKNMNQTTN